MALIAAQTYDGAASPARENRHMMMPHNGEIAGAGGADVRPEPKSINCPMRLIGEANADFGRDKINEISAPFLMEWSRVAVAKEPRGLTNEDGRRTAISFGPRHNWLGQTTPSFRHPMMPEMPIPLPAPPMPMDNSPMHYSVMMMPHDMPMPAVGLC